MQATYPHSRSGAPTPMRRCHPRTRPKSLPFPARLTVENPCWACSLERSDPDQTGGFSINSLQEIVRSNRCLDQTQSSNCANNNRACPAPASSVLSNYPERTKSLGSCFVVSLCPSVSSDARIPLCPMTSHELSVPLASDAVPSNFQSRVWILPSSPHPSSW